MIKTCSPKNLLSFSVLTHTFVNTCGNRSTRVGKQLLRRRMSTSRPDHMDRTKDNTRQEILSPAKVVEMRDLSKTVKMLGLEVINKDFYFKAGQWIDMIIPGVDKVGGYSMTSAPYLLTSQQKLELAIKYSTHPPAYWVHTKCKVGAEVLIRAGGDFFYSPSPSQTNYDVLLLAGGVGINPLYSILQHFVHIHQTTHTEQSSDSGPKLSLLFSARNEDELIFKDDLMSICDSNNNTQLKLFCTREKVKADGLLEGRRVELQDVQSALNFVDKSRLLVYICGPSSFIKSMEQDCLECGVPGTNIIYEHWW